MNIRLSSVRAVADRLESSGIAYASGGSGLTHQDKLGNALSFRSSYSFAETGNNP